MLLTAARPSVGTTQLPLGHATVSPFPHAHLPSGMLDRAAPLPRHPACLPETAVGVSPSAMLRLPLDPRYELIKKDLSRNLAPLHAERRPTQQTRANSCVAAASHARKIVVIQGGNCQQMFHQHTGSEYPPYQFHHWSKAWTCRRSLHLWAEAALLLSRTTRPPSPANRGCNSLLRRRGQPVSSLPASPCYPRRANTGALLGESPSKIHLSMPQEQMSSSVPPKILQLFPDRSARAFVRRTPRLSSTLVTRTCCFLYTCLPMMD